jgi:hypothetical protein
MYACNIRAVAFTNDNETKSPLARLFKELMPSLRKQYKSGKIVGGREASRVKHLPAMPTRALVARVAAAVPAPAVASANGVTRARVKLSNEASAFDTMVACDVSNYSCARRVLHTGELDWRALGIEADAANTPAAGEESNEARLVSALR